MAPRLGRADCARCRSSTPTAAPDRTVWGYPWDVQTRWSFYPAGSPNVVVTAFAASGLLEGAAALDRGDLAAMRGRSVD